MDDLKVALEELKDRVGFRRACRRVVQGRARSAWRWAWAWGLPGRGAGGIGPGAGGSCDLKLGLRARTPRDSAHLLCRTSNWTPSFLSPDGNQIAFFLELESDRTTTTFYVKLVALERRSA